MERTGAKKNAMFAGRAARVRRPAGGAARFTPSCSNTSALPQRLDTDRLPCFATFTPQAATTMAAADEMLNVPGPIAAGAARIEHLAGGSSSASPRARASSAQSRRSPPAARPSSRSADSSPASARARTGLPSPRAWRLAASSVVRSSWRNELFDQRREHHRSRKFRRIFRPSLCRAPTRDETARRAPDTCGAAPP